MSEIVTAEAGPGALEGLSASARAARPDETMDPLSSRFPVGIVPAPDLIRRYTSFDGLIASIWRA